MGKILIKNKKGGQEKPSQTKRTAAPAEQNAAAANSLDGANPSANSQETQGLACAITTADYTQP